MERKLKLGIASMGVSLLLGSTFANAEVALNAQGVQYGSFTFVPAVKATVGYDDNVYNFSGTEIGSWYAGVAPQFVWIAQDRNNTYQIVYGLDGRTYSHRSDDSYLDQNLGLKAHLEPNARLRLDGGLGYKMQHDARGSGRSTGYQWLPNAKTGSISAMGEVDKYDVASLTAGFEYGAKDAAGMLLGSVGLDSKGYDRDLVANGRDNDRKNMALGFHVRLMPKTKATIELEHVDTDYDGATADTVDDRYYVGLLWENTVQTTGKARFGQSKRKVKSAAGTSDGDKFSWDVGLNWSPLERDMVTFVTGRAIADAEDTGATSLNTNYGIQWKHQWLDRLNTELGYGINKSEYATRDDDSKKYRIAANYQMRRWLVLSCELDMTDRNSDDPAFDTKRNIYAIGAQLSL